MRRIMQRILVMTAAALGLMGLAAVPAWAAPQPVGGCGAGFELMTVKEVIRTIAAPGSVDAIRAGDVNQDGYLCIKIVPNGGGPPQFDPAFVFVDNTANG